MLIDYLDTAKKADAVINRCATRDPCALASALDITVLPRAFEKQLGAYKVILKNRFIFIKNDLDYEMKRLVLLHEIGHDVLHRKTAVKTGGFNEYDIFDMCDRQMETEANIFAAQAILSDDEMLEYISMGYNAAQTAAAAGTDINIVSLKAAVLIEKGIPLNRQEYRSGFLKRR